MSLYVLELELELDRDDDELDDELPRDAFDARGQSAVDQAGDAVVGRAPPAELERDVRVLRNLDVRHDPDLNRLLGCGDLLTGRGDVEGRRLRFRLPLPLLSRFSIRIRHSRA